MKSSCIRHPEKNRYLQLYEWQIAFCQNNHCAAMLLAFFIAWHEWKINHDHYYKRANDIAEMHGDGRLHDENAYLFFTLEELIIGCMGFYGKNAINEALKLLSSLNVITIHKNPNPRYHFDKTKYFKLYPGVCNQWIQEHYLLKKPEIQEEETQLVDLFDIPKEEDAFTEKGRPSIEIGRPSSEKGRYIKNYTTNNKTNNNQSFHDGDKFLNKAQKNENDVQSIINLLIEQGLPAEKFQYDDVRVEMKRLLASGATTDFFLKAYEISHHITQGNFGIRYLVKVVEGLLAKSDKNLKASKPYFSEKKTHRASQALPPLAECEYENNLKNAESWAGDLLK